MSMRHTRSSSRRKFSGSPLIMPQLNTSGPMAIDDMDHSPGGWLRRICFDEPLTPLSSEVDGGTPSFDSTDTLMDIDVAYTPRSWLRRICFGDPLTPTSSEGDFFDSLFEPGSSDVSTDQIPFTYQAISGRPDDRQLPPALTREATYETFDGPLTPLASDMEMDSEEEGRRKSTEALLTSKDKSNAYTKPQGSMFDAAHACEWFPDPPPVPESETVVSNFADLRKIVQFPPSAWHLGPDGRLVRNYDVKFESPSLPIVGPMPVAGIVEREMRALMRRREEVTRVLEEEGVMVPMRGMDADELLAEAGLNRPKPGPLGPEGTEIYDGVSEYPEEWASHQSAGLCYHPTE